MSAPAAKRRRIDAASQALSKPFRSPLKASLTDPAAGARPAPKLHNSSTEARITLSNSIVLPHSSKVAQLTATPVRTTPARNPFSSPIASAGLNADPDVAPLLKTQRELEKQLRELKEELDKAEHARKIEADSERKNPCGGVDGELVELTQKWRSASRQAAEELFTSVRDRVNRLGGPKAWKEMEDRRKEFQSGWDAEAQPAPDWDNEDAQNLEKRDLYAEYDIEPETANEKEARGGNDVVEDEGAEDEFTMAMMLRSLNVPLSTIGYDREQQRWGD